MAQPSIWTHVARHSVAVALGCGIGFVVHLRLSGETVPGWDLPGWSGMVYRWRNPQWDEIRLKVDQELSQRHAYWAAVQQQGRERPAS